MYDCSRRHMKKACVLFGFGCSRSEVESARLVEYLKKNRWHLTRDLRDAELILLGTCGVTRLIEDLGMALVSTASRKRRRGAKIVVFGCMPAMNEKRLRENFEVITLTPSTMGRLDDILGSAVRMEEIGDPNELDSYSGLMKESFSARDRLGV